MPDSALLKDSIDPELRSNAFRNAYVGAPAFGLIGVAVVARSLWSYRSGALAPGLLGLNTAIGLLLLWVAWYLWRSLHWNRRVTWLLEATPDRPMRVCFGVNERGTLMAVLHAVSDLDLKEPHVRFLCLRPSWSYDAVEGEVVRAYVDPTPGGPVVLRTSRGILWPLERTPRQDVEQTSGQPAPA